MMSRSSHCRRWWAFFSLVVLLGSGLPMRAADATPLIQQAKDFMEEEKFLDALASAKDAVRADEQNYKSYYYVALAQIGLGQFGPASEAAAQAFALAPEEGKPAVTKLIEVIKARSQGASTAEAAAAALADGLAGKAARLYEQAWNAGQDNPELGLQAAELYAHRLEQPLDAGRVLYQVRRVARGSDVARVDALLQELAAPLRESAVNYVDKARVSRDPREQQDLLANAAAADPTYPEIYTVALRLAAQGDSVEAMLAALKGLARRNLATAKQIGRLPKRAHWLENPAIKEFLTDILGAAQVARLQPADRGVGGGMEIEDLGLKLMPIKAGLFTMGSSNGISNETPHSVTITHDYHMGQTEVTQAQWTTIMGSNPSGFKGDDLPVVQVSWDECVEFCRKLTERERAAGRLPEGYLYQLPTEAEWEYACRAGTSGDYGGNGNSGSMGWYAENSGSTPHPVAQKDANAWGLYDMHGNVWECCHDWYGVYPAGSATDPMGASSGSVRVIRGGSCSEGASDSRSACRNGTVPGGRYRNLGFRIALSSVR